jgi:hypothetical protein
MHAFLLAVLQLLGLFVVAEQHRVRLLQLLLPLVQLLPTTKCQLMHIISYTQN